MARSTSRQLPATSNFFHTVTFTCRLDACSDVIKCTVWVKKNPPCGFLTFFSKQLGIFRPNFTHLLYVSIYARLQIFIQLSAILTKLCHIKRDHPVHAICSKCPPSAETHAGIFRHFSKAIANFWSKFYTPIIRSYLCLIANFYPVIYNCDEVTSMPY